MPVCTRCKTEKPIEEFLTCTGRILTRRCTACRERLKLYEQHGKENRQAAKRYSWPLCETDEGQAERFRPVVTCICGRKNCNRSVCKERQ